MLRFLVLGIILLVLVMAVFAVGLDFLGLLPDTGATDFTFGRGRMPVPTVLATWVLEAIALAALFLLLQGRGGSWWLDGLLTGWIAWVFRAPLQVLTVAAATHLSPDPWWSMAVRWLALYSVCGLLLAALARRTGLQQEVPS